jgi:hypothetical protein
MSRRMQPRQLKALIESGHYKPEAAHVAEAMLQRRAVRELLAGRSFSAAGRSPSPSTAGRRAA